MSFNFRYTSDTYSKFEYIPKNSPIGVASDIPAVIDRIKGNALDFSTKFSSGEVTKPILTKIAQELESTARYFGAQQGLSTSRLLDKENLYAEVFGNYINFVNKAQDNYGRFYAGHVEYGHYSKNRKKFVEARPFMRPALYAVSKSSQGEIADVLKEVLRGVFLEEGLSGLKFGSYLGEASKRYPYSYETVKGLLSSKIYESDEGHYRQDDKLFGKHMGPKRDNFVMTGRDFSTLPGFEKQMSKWSLKRYSGSKSQKQMRKIHGFDGARRNPLKIKQNFHSSATPRRVEQARIHSNYGSNKREYNYDGSRNSHTVKKVSDFKGENSITQGKMFEEDALRGRKVVDSRKQSKYKISEIERIKRASIKPKTQYDRPITPWSSYDKTSASSLRRYNHRSGLVVDKVRKTKKYMAKYPKKSSKKKKFAGTPKRTPIADQEKVVIKVYSQDPSVILDDNMRAKFLKSQFITYSLTKEEFESQRVHLKHYTKDMYYR